MAGQWHGWLRPLAHAGDLVMKHSFPCTRNAYFWKNSLLVYTKHLLLRRGRPSAGLGDKQIVNISKEIAMLFLSSSFQVIKLGPD